MPVQRSGQDLGIENDKSSEEVVMNPRELFLLQTMDIALGLSQGDQLAATQVNELARKGGIDAPETLRLVEELASQGVVQQHWGGSVSVTEKGKECAPSSGGHNTMRILFLAANPSQTSRLDLEDELRNLEQELRGVKFRDSITLI